MRRSTIRARTSEATMKPAAMRSRCHSMWRQLRRRRWGSSELGERPPAGEAVLVGMPPLDPLLPELPAEQHGLAVGAERREVDEAGIQVLDEQPELLERGDRVAQPFLGLGGGL